MGGHRAPGLSGLVTEVMQATGDAGARWMLDLCNGVVEGGGVPDGWGSSVVLPIYKGKGDPMECGSTGGRVALWGVDLVEGLGCWSML